MEPTTTDKGDPRLARTAIDGFAETTVRQAGVPEARERLMQALDRLHSHIGNLLERVDPVLAPGHPINLTAEAVMAGGPDHSDIANWIHQQAASVEAANERINEAANRVDL